MSRHISIGRVKSQLDILGPAANEAEVLRRFIRCLNRPQTKTSMLDLLDTGHGNRLPAPVTPEEASISTHGRTLLQVAQFLRRELPVRFAHRARDLDKLDISEGLSGTKGIKTVIGWYEQSFRELVSLPVPTTLEDEAGFAKAVGTILHRHADTNVQIARGLSELRREAGLTYEELADRKELHDGIDRFFLDRIGIRVLIGHYLDLHELKEGVVGSIENTVAGRVARDAAADAQYMCERKYGFAPEVMFLGERNLSFKYIPSHLYYILFETLKNSLRATVEHFEKDETRCPPVKVIIGDGDESEDVVIKVSDEGGGIKREQVDRIFSYLYTTAREGDTHDFGSDDLHDFGTQTPLAGLGYGLPVARLYARYFHGDLELKTIAGFGTDVYIRLRRLRKVRGSDIAI